MRIPILAWLGLFTLSTVAEDKVVVGYYVPWGKVEPEAINYDKVTHINYGFGVLYKKDDPASIFVDRYYDGNKIRKLKQLASKKNVKVLMSLGGWTGSQTFSIVVRDAELRKKFINNAMVFVRKNTKPEYDESPDGWELDGIDLDWEYPNRAAAKCNEFAVADSANYLLLLKELREAMDLEFPNEHKLLTAAVRVKPFDGPDGKPMSDVSAFATYFDFVNIMAYDIMGSWSKTTGPNAPFSSDLGKGADPFSFTQGVEDWLAAGFPANKLTAGLAFYGRTLTTTVNMNEYSMYGAKESITPKGDQSDSSDSNFFCNEGSFFSGVYKYKFLRQDILVSSPTQASNGFIRYFDNTTQTPWLFNPTTKKFISYDDPISIQIKVNYVKQKNIRGTMIWEMSHDYQDELLNIANQVRDGNPVIVVPTSTTSNAPTIPSNVPTSTNIPTSTPPPNPQPTGTCNENIQQCIQAGKSPKFNTCVHGEWLEQTCASGTVCRQNGNAIYCDFP